MPAQLPPISRRQLFAGGLAAAASWLWTGRLLGAQFKRDASRWVLLADTHICAERERTHRGIRPAVTFGQARREILALDPPPAGMILAGDCAYIEGQPGDYAVLVEETAPLREAELPLYFVLGNHDHRANFSAAFPERKPAGDGPVAEKHVGLIETPAANWLLLDSLKKTNYTPGELGAAQLEWLAAQLAAQPDKPALLVAHHNLNPPEQPEGSGLLDTPAFWELATAHKQVKAYFFGHTHRWSVEQKDGIWLVNVPAVAWLFDESQPRGWLDVALHPDGATVVLHALDPRHPKHGARVELKWRA